MIISASLSFARSDSGYVIFAAVKPKVRHKLFIFEMLVSQVGNIVIVLGNVVWWSAIMGFAVYACDVRCRNLSIRRFSVFLWMGYKVQCYSVIKYDPVKFQKATVGKNHFHAVSRMPSVLNVLETSLTNGEQLVFSYTISGDQHTFCDIRTHKIRLTGVAKIFT